ncbi:MAG: alanine--tRNA ligase [Flexilinea sp.]
MKSELSGNEIRQQFIDFFVKKGHTAVRSASLVPAGDQTLLFTNAGMVQFKEVFLGTDKRPYSRACDSQKCMRVAGKHNDLDDVGRDDSHHTFFEMLGNWSFGDYYKKEAISWAWELLTEVWGLNKQDLWTTCFKDEKGEVDADEEAYNFWKIQPGIDRDHILYFGRKDNFWEMADTGPCGPCSEIHIDLGPDRCNKKGVPGHVCRVNGDCSRFMELWNLVFIQYNRLNPDTLIPLTQQFVDTGMGFERIVSVIQKTDSNYKTDLFKPMMRSIQKLTGVETSEMYTNFTPYRVIADHARAASFLIADGVVPGNIGRNYVCRMIIRRAVRFGQQIGIREPFMGKIAEAVIESYQQAYPELAQMRTAILKSISWEEDRFNKTLDNGISHLNDIIAEMGKNGQKIIDGETCFDLYSTHGLPLEITYDIVREYGLEVDRSGFLKASEVHRIASGGGKAIGHMGGEDAEQYAVFLAYLKDQGLVDNSGVKYDPYDSKPLQSKLVMLIRDRENVFELAEGDEAELITDSTNFYLEMGGQVGDSGTIRGLKDDFLFEVDFIRRPSAGLIVHHGVLKKGIAKIGDPVIVTVDRERRHDIMRNHTATHLLHAALHQVIGEHARQAGSLVAPDRLRFDFNSNQPLTEDQISEIEDIVNEKILESIPVYTRVENLNDAIGEGVTALFNEKYGDEVRVVRISENEDEIVSAELCGGTHVDNTSEIGLFMIISEGSVATGIRRIEAITGREANTDLRKKFNEIRRMAVIMNVPIDSVLERSEFLQEQIHKTQKEIADLRNELALSDFAKLSDHIQKIDDVNLLTINIPNATLETLRTLADKFKSENQNAVGVFSSIIDDKVMFIATVADSLVKRGLHAGEIVTSASAITGGKGGGKPTMAQGGGKETAKIQEALDTAVKLVKNKLKG